MISGSNDAQDTSNTSRDDPPAVRRAVILAAGKGNRLEPLTADVPKCMVEIGGEPLLERALRALASHGIAEAVIVIGYLAEAVRDEIILTRTSCCSRLMSCSIPRS